MKAEGVITNTHYVDINGMAFHKNGTTPRKLTVRFTSDERGETLSIADEENGFMFAVPFAKVDKLIEEARAERGKRID